MINVIIVLITLLPGCITSSSIPKSVNINYLMTQIILNEPTTSLLNAYNLAIAINKASLIHDVPPRLLSAIMAQESRYKLNSINVKSLDYGIGQINHRTVKFYKLDRNRLLTDLEYSVSASALVLSDIKSKYAPHEHSPSEVALSSKKQQTTSPSEVDYSPPRKKITGELDWWTRYNSRHPKARARYKKLVTRFL